MKQKTEAQISRQIRKCSVFQKSTLSDSEDWTTPWDVERRCSRASVNSLPWAELSVCLLDLTFPTVGQVLSSMPVHIFLFIFFHPLPQIPSIVEFTLLLCNRHVANYSSVLSFSSFPRFPTACAPQEIRLIWRWSMRQTHRQRDRHMRGLNNKIISALGWWNLQFLQMTVSLALGEGKKKRRNNNNLAQACILNCQESNIYCRENTETTLKQHAVQKDTCPRSHTSD